MEKYKIAILDMVPTHYRIPIYEKLAKNPNIKFTLYFSSDYGTTKIFNKAFNTEMKWEYNLDNINYKFLKNYYPQKNPMPPKGMWNFGIIKDIIKNKFDAILITSYTPLSHKLAMIAAKLTKTPIIIKEEADLIKQPRGIRGLLKNIFLRLMIKNSDAFLYGYKKNRDFYTHFGAKKEDLFFFPCAVDNDMFQTQKKELQPKNELKQNLGFSPKDFVGIFIGRIIPIKNVSHIVKATEKLQKINIPVGLIILGEGIERKTIEKFIKTNKVKGIKFVGFKQQKELAPYIKAADFSILASSEDRSPKSLNETMNFGLPAIVTDAVATAHDLVKKGKTGFIYPAGNINKLSKYIEKLYKNKNLYKDMSRNTDSLIKDWNFDKDIKGLMEAIKYVTKNKYKE